MMEFDTEELILVIKSFMKKSRPSDLNVWSETTVKVFILLAMFRVSCFSHKNVPSDRQIDPALWVEWSDECGYVDYVTFRHQGRHFDNCLIGHQVVLNQLYLLFFKDF